MAQNQDVLSRGMLLLERLPEITPDKADERVLRVFEETCQTLRVPVVNRIFRTLGNYPDLLEASWGAVRDILRTRAFEEDADWVRAASVLEPIPVGRTVRSAAGEEIDRLRAVTNTIHYVLPKLLLLATAFEAMLHTRHSAEHAGTGRPRAKEKLPAGPAPGTVTFQMIAPTDADGLVRELYEDIQRIHGHPAVASYYRALATRPDFLAAAWEQISPIIGSEPWRRRKRLLLNAAEAIVREWDLPDLPPEKVSPEARAVVAAYRRVLIPDVLMDATMVKGMLDGTRAARHSPFSATGVPPAGH